MYPFSLLALSFSSLTLAVPLSDTVPTATPFVDLLHKRQDSTQSALIAGYSGLVEAALTSEGTLDYSYFQATCDSFLSSSSLSSFPSATSPSTLTSSFLRAATDDDAATVSGLDIPIFSVEPFDPTVDYATRTSAIAADTYTEPREGGPDATSSSGGGAATQAAGEGAGVSLRAGKIGFALLVAALTAIAGTL
ncbi:hypothetical protein JCM8547_009022 [Rhodosporidiobolus lusitaniae]